MRKNSLLPGLTLMLAEGSLEIPALIGACILEIPELAEKYAKIARETSEKFQKIAKEYENCQADPDYQDWGQYFQDVSADLSKEAGDTEHLVSMFQRISRIANEVKRCSSSTESSAESAEGEAAESAEGEAPAEATEAEEAPANDVGSEESASAGAAEGVVCFGNSFNKIEECKKDPEKLNAIIEECKKLSELFKKCAESEGEWATYYGNWYKSSCDPNWRHNQLKNELMRDHHEAMAAYFNEVSERINPESASAEGENSEAPAEEGNSENAEGEAPAAEA